MTDRDQVADATVPSFNRSGSGGTWPLTPYKQLPRKKVKLPERSMKDAYDDRATLKGKRFVEARY
jgi:hypothetical protein